MNSYLAINKDKQILEKSSSGGVFFELAKYIIEKEQGIVFGAAWNSDWLVDMQYADNLEGVKRFIGSKYVKANNQNTFAECKDFLDNNKTVLYTGTPCQIFALKSYLGKDYNKLLTVSVACFGTMPKNIWLDYLSSLQRPGLKITNIDLRNKQNATWDSYNFIITYSDGSKLIEDHRYNKYYKLFVSGNYLNKPCYNCIAKKNLNSDLSIGDFWGVKNYYKVDSTKGVSFINTISEKGQKYYNLIKDKFITQPVDINNIRKYNNGIVDVNNSIQKEYSKDFFKKRVGIVSMNLYYNIGGQLQSYALQKIINKFGYDADCITWKRNDRLPFIDSHASLRILDSSHDFNKIKEFDYDIYVVGSDQVWRKNCMFNDYGSTYALNYPFLGFTNNWNKVRFSYAASFGFAGANWKFNSNENIELRNKLKCFNKLSVRELESVEDCKKYLNLDVNQFIDPTMLLEKSNYLELCSNISQKINGIFPYLLSNNTEKTKFLNNLKNNLKLDTINYNNKSVEDWLAAMRDCKILLTDSFHGVVFAIIFNKPFLYWDSRDAGNIRFDSLDKLFNIKDRRITDKFVWKEEYLNLPNINIDRQPALDYINSGLHDIPKIMRIK